MFEEISEDILFIVWCFWQYLRIIMFINNQRKAKKKIINKIDLHIEHETTLH